MIIVDSREKKWDHIRLYMEENGIEYCVHKLDVGDYINTNNASIVIDRKANLQELCGNLSKGDSNIMRFTREVKRAKEAKIRFIVLIEGTSYQTVKEVASWKSKYTKHTGRWLTDKMFNLTVSYGVEWMFCRRNQTAQRIMEILGYEEHL